VLGAGTNAASADNDNVIADVIAMTIARMFDFMEVRGVSGH
jgi:hypothetical protein